MKLADFDYDLPEDAAEDSHNLLPLLKGETDAIRHTHVHNTYKNEYAIRHGEWLLIEAKDGYVSRRNEAWEAKRNYPPDDDHSVELYNLKQDIGQKTNLAGSFPNKVRELQSLLVTIRERGYSAPRLAKRSVTPGTATAEQ